MNFEEVLLPLDNHKYYFCFTRKHPGVSPDEYRDVSHAYAWMAGVNTAARVDLLELVSMAIPAEEEKATMISKGQQYLEKTIQQRGTNVPEHELQSLEQQIYLTEHLSKPSRAIPSHVLSSRSGHVLVCCENTHLAGGGVHRRFMVRLVDAINAEVITEVHIAGKDSFFNNALKKIRNFGEPLAMNAQGDKALFWTMGKAYIADTQNKFKRISKKMANIERNYAAWCSGRWVVLNTNADCTESTISLLHENSGKLCQQFTLKGCARSIDTCSEFGLILVGHMGGKCDLIDITHSSIRTFKPHKTIKRGTFIHARLSDDGLLFATWNYDDQQLIITEIASGNSYLVADLLISESLLYQGRYGRLNKIMEPGFGFVGGQLLSIKNGMVTLYNVEAICQASAKCLGTTEVSSKKSHRYDDTLSLEENIERFGLQSAKQKILPYHWPAIQLHLTTSNGNIAAGASKLGGQADLPENITWPNYKNRPMVFFAQINLEELSEWFPYSPLPSNGLLSFFIGISEDCDGPIPMGVAEEKDMWKVMHIPDLNSLSRRDYPDFPEGTYGTKVKECSITFSLKGPVFPNDDSVAITQMGLTDEEFSAYQDFIEQVNPSEEDLDSGYQHQLLGYPYYIQGNDMELMCQRGFQGKNIYTTSKEPAEAKREQQAAADWRLLLQLGSDEENTDLLWGDAGLIYWYIRKQDLEQRNFNNTWVQFQN